MQIKTELEIRAVDELESVIASELKLQDPDDVDLEKLGGKDETAAKHDRGTSSGSN